MNLPSASYLVRCGKLSNSWGNSNESVPELNVTKNCKYQPYRNQSPEITSEDMDSVYSDAGDTFASRPSNAYEDHAGSSGLSYARHTDGTSRDFILKRFLPAAQAMATGATASTSTSSVPSEQRLIPNANFTTIGRPGPIVQGSSKVKSRFVHEVKQDARNDFDDESDEISACGFPLRLGRMTLQHLRYSFWTTRSNSHSRSPQKSIKKVTDKVIQDGRSENSDDLFWSEEEDVDDAESIAKSGVMTNERERFSEGRKPKMDMSKALAAEMLAHIHAPPARLHSMETVHTPDHKGFLGLPKTTKCNSGEAERARQVDRLGARLTRMISKANYIESRHIQVNEHEEIEAGGSSQGPSATSSSSAEVPRAKWVDKVPARRKLLPPPSPKMPSESWLANTLPPSRFAEVKKLPRKPLGSYIPIKPPVKPSEQLTCEDVSIRLRQSCSLKEHLQGRFSALQCKRSDRNAENGRNSSRLGDTFS